MNTTQQTFGENKNLEGKSAKAVLNDSLAEGILGAGAAILALAGLLNIMPERMFSVSAIIMGTAFLLEGETISARASRLVAKPGKNRLQEEQPGVGVTAEFVVGLTGVVLGLVALLGLYPLIVVPVAVVAYGSALIAGSGLTARLNDLEIAGSGELACFTRVVCEAVSTASGIEFLFGLGAGILGIIALTGMEAVRLSLLALLIVGAGSLVNGAVIVARIAGAHRR